MPTLLKPPRVERQFDTTGLRPFYVDRVSMVRARPLIP
jgi:hypothetical protein